MADIDETAGASEAGRAAKTAESGGSGAPGGQDERLSITGAMKALGLRSRKSIYNYEQRGWLRIDHDHKGKPFILQSQVDLVLRKKGDKVSKGKYIPEGHIVIEEDRYNAAQQRLTYLEAQAREMPLLLEQIDADKDRIAELEAELAKRDQAGLVKRLLKKW